MSSHVSTRLIRINPGQETSSEGDAAPSEELDEKPSDFAGIGSCSDNGGIVHVIDGRFG